MQFGCSTWKISEQTGEMALEESKRGRGLFFSPSNGKILGKDYTVMESFVGYILPFVPLRLLGLRRGDKGRTVLLLYLIRTVQNNANGGEGVLGRERCNSLNPTGGPE